MKFSVARIQIHSLIGSLNIFIVPVFVTYIAIGQKVHSSLEKLLESVARYIN